MALLIFNNSKSVRINQDHPALNTTSNKQTQLWVDIKCGEMIMHRSILSIRVFLILSGLIIRTPVLLKRKSIEKF